MFQKSAHIPASQIAETGVAVLVIKQVLVVLEKHLVEMHAVAGLIVKRLGHEGDRATALLGDHLDDVFDPRRGVAHMIHGLKQDFDLALAGPPTSWW